MDKRINKIEQQLESVNNLNCDPNIIISELNERKKREYEVVIFNVPESNKPAGLDRSSDDTEQVTASIPADILNKIPDIKPRRLGKPIQGKTRPILLYTPSPAIAREILKINPDGDTGIKFKPSQTQKQQQHLNTLRAELNELNKDGDSKTIKYINGVPKIIDKPAFQAPKKKKKKQSKLTILYQNTRGLRTILHQFLTSTACFNGDIICASKTWLHSSISDGEIIDNSFK